MHKVFLIKNTCIKPIFNDKRSKHIIWVSHCILNQNARFPGCAVSQGVIKEIIRPIIDEGVGIEQLPCPEMIGWGGINRSKVFEWKGDPNEEWITKYNNLCQRLAREVVNEMERTIENGYTVIGIIAIDGSPTCGMNKTCDIPYCWQKLSEATNGFSYIDIDIMRQIGQKCYRDGAGQFMGRIKHEIEKKKLSIPIIGFSPWTDILKAEEILKTWGIIK